MITGATNTPNLKLAAHNGILWKDLGNGGTTGNLTTGTIKTAAAATIFSYYTLATTDTFRCVKCEADAGRDTIVIAPGPAIIGSNVLENFTIINWTPSAPIFVKEFGFFYAMIENSNLFKVETINHQGCIAFDFVEVISNPLIINNIFYRCVSHE